MLHGRIQKGWTGDPDPPENHNNIGFLSNTCPDPLKITKLRGQHSFLGYHWHASQTPFKWHFSGGLMIALIVVIGSSLSSSTKKKKKKSWTPSDKTFWIRTCVGPDPDL